VPAISTGIFGYPLEEAAKVILGSIRDHLATHTSPLERVVVCLFDQTALRVFETELREQIVGEGA
jgi:O-acetyl-ADP-ribose deacetylase (regulator of RNase III)